MKKILVTENGVCEVDAMLGRYEKNERLVSLMYQYDIDEDDMQKIYDLIVKDYLELINAFRPN